MGRIDHKMSRDTGGQGMTSWIRPRCSCGWEGRAEYAYEDCQHTNVREQEEQHLAKIAEKGQTND
jgi:hypothetical protein